MPRQHDIRKLAFAFLRRPQTLAVAGFLAIVSGIVANALFLQSGPHPAPFFFTHEPEASTATKPDELVRSVQDSLKQLGYYAGPLDGLAGAQTRAAIKDFQLQAGMEPNEEATLQLLAEIHSASRPDLAPVPTRVVPLADRQEPAPLPAQPETRPAQSDGMVAAIQDALARAAYGPLVADGVVGPGTREAIKRFQRDHNLPITGEISDALVVELRAAGALGGN